MAAHARRPVRTSSTTTSLSGLVRILLREFPELKVPPRDASLLGGRVMSWLESHQSLRDHPKKDRLAELLFRGLGSRRCRRPRSHRSPAPPVVVGDRLRTEGRTRRFHRPPARQGLRLDRRGRSAAARRSSRPASSTARPASSTTGANTRVVSSSSARPRRSASGHVRAASGGRPADAPQVGERTYLPTNQPTIPTYQGRIFHRVRTGVVRCRPSGSTSSASARSGAPPCRLPRCGRSASSPLWASGPAPNAGA